MVKDGGHQRLEQDVEAFLLDVRRLTFHDLRSRESGDRKAALKAYLESLIAKVEAGVYANTGQVM